MDRNETELTEGWCWYISVYVLGVYSSYVRTVKKIYLYSLDRFFGLDTDPRFGFFYYISEKLCGTFLTVFAQDVTYQQVSSNIDLKPENIDF